MKKIIVIFPLLICFFAQAQDDYSNLIILTGGATMPNGDLSSTDFNSSSAGFAKTGFTGDLAFQHKLKKSKYLGYTATVRYQNYSFNQDAFTTGYQGTSTDATAWSATSIVVGPIWTFAVSNKISIEPRAMLGLAFAKSPHVMAYGEGNLEVPSESATSFSYLAGVNGRFDLWKRISLFVRVDYQSAKPKFTYSQSSSSITMSSINSSLGVGYRFK